MKRLYPALAAIALVFTLSDFTACKSTPTVESVNAFAQCKSVGQCYLATTGTYNSSQLAAIELLHNPDTPQAVKDAIKKADAAATPVIEDLSKAYTLYRNVKADLNTCAPDDAACKSDSIDKILAATANVQKWLTEAGPLVTDLLNLAGGETP